MICSVDPPGTNNSTNSNRPSPSHGENRGSSSLGSARSFVANLLLFAQSFEAVLEFIQFSLTLCWFFTVLGVIVLRFTKPAHPRPYRTWGYPATPIIFLSVTFFMMGYLLINRPLQSLAGVLVMLARLIIYAIAQYYPAVPPAQKAIAIKRIS